nr:GntR family transcriptional regulator [Azospirillum palustre]
MTVRSGWTSGSSAASSASAAPIREALALLEQDGFIRLQPRRGIFVVRKTKTEIGLSRWLSAPIMAVTLYMIRYNETDAPWRRFLP